MEVVRENEIFTVEPVFHRNNSKVSSNRLKRRKLNLKYHVENALHSFGIKAAK